MCTVALVCAVAVAVVMLSKRDAEKFFRVATLAAQDEARLQAATVAPQSAEPVEQSLFSVSETAVPPRPIIDGLTPPEGHKLVREIGTAPLNRSPNSTAGKRGDFRPRSSRLHPLQGVYGWVFKRYVPSPLESEYIAATRAPDASLTALRAKFQTRLEAVVKQSAPHVLPRSHDFLSRVDDLAAACGQHRSNADVSLAGSCHDDPTVMDESLFSYFLYEFRCIEQPCAALPSSARNAIGDLHKSFIEPLVGDLKHPLAFLSASSTASHGTSRESVLIDKWALHHLLARNTIPVPHRKSHYFDVNSGVFHPDTSKSAQAWFIGVAECLCIPFTTTRLWDGFSHRLSEVWDVLPDYLHPGYQWFNFAPSGDAYSWRNPLNHLLEKVNIGDTVFVRVSSAEGTRVERKLMQLLLQRLPDLAPIIDELFLEIPLTFEQASTTTLTDKVFVADALNSFATLRAAGIRAHGW